jgi:methionine synthase I (cobalamin-dependent)
LIKKTRNFTFGSAIPKQSSQKLEKKITEINEEVIELKRQIADIKTITAISYVIIFVLEQGRSSLNQL